MFRYTNVHSWDPCMFDNNDDCFIICNLELEYCLCCVCYYCFLFIINLGYISKYFRQVIVNNIDQNNFIIKSSRKLLVLMSYM